MVKRGFLKRTLATLAALVLALALLPGSALADAGGLRIEQVQAELPALRAYFYLEGGAASDAPNITATLDGKALELENLRRYDADQDPTSYFFLVDCSTSTSYDQMEAVKAALLETAAGLAAGDTFTLLTFGVDVQVALRRENDLSAITAAVQQLVPDQPGTLFFDALAKAIDLAGNSEFALERKLAFVFSDSVDYNLGGYTREEIDKLLAATGLPFYALGFDTGTKQELDNFGAVARTSGGAISVVSSASLPDAMREMVAATKTVYVADFDTGSNVVGANTQEFSITAPDTGDSALLQIPVRFWRPDTAAPTITNAAQQSPESIALTFSEPVQGAGSPDSFVVKNTAGDLLGVRAAAYDEATHSVVLTFSAPPASGALSVECPGITDLSMEQHKIAEPVTLDFEGTPEAPAPQEEAPVGAWIVVGLVLAAVIVAIAIAAGRRKKRAEQAEAQTFAATPGGAAQSEVEAGAADPGMQVHFVQNSAPLPKITLRVTGPTGESRTVEVPVNKTLFVGRSDICDVYFDDTAMSRQHFVIGEEGGVYTLTNLSETGGTLLNGVPVQKPRPLSDGDTISAGRQTLRFFSTTAGGVS